MPAEGRHTHTIHALIVENYQEHVHARVCSALTYSVLQCPGVMLGFTGDGVWAHLVACASRDATSPTMDHGLCYCATHTIIFPAHTISKAVQMFQNDLVKE